MRHSISDAMAAGVLSDEIVLLRLWVVHSWRRHAGGGHGVACGFGWDPSLGGNTSSVALCCCIHRPMQRGTEFRPWPFRLLSEGHLPGCLALSIDTL